MICRPALLIAVLAVSATGQPDSKLTRSFFYSNDAHKFSFWIPGRVNTQSETRPGFLAEYTSIVEGKMCSVSIKANAISRAAFRLKTDKTVKDALPGSKVEYLEDPAGFIYPTSLALHTNLDQVPGYEHRERVVAAVQLRRNMVINMVVDCPKGSTRYMVEVIKWMTYTLRSHGETGFEKFTGPRQLDRKTGLSYRVQARFQQKDSGAVVFEGVDGASGDVVVLAKWDGKPEEAGSALAGDMKRTGKSWRLPRADGKAVDLGFYTSRDEKSGVETGQVQAVVELDGGLFTLKVRGNAVRKVDLARDAEVVAAALQWVDIAKAEKDALSASRELDLAIRKKNVGHTSQLLDALITGSFLPAARTAIEKALPKLDEALQVRVVEALAAGKDVRVVPLLVKTYRTSKFKNRGRMRRTVLKSLRYLQSRDSLKLLLREAKSKDLTLAAGAFYSLGHFKEDRAEVLRVVVPLFKKEEDAGKRRGFKPHQRWVAMRPALQNCLHRLSGEKLETAAAAAAWYRANR